MRIRFGPSHYYRDIYKKLQSLTRGSRNVKDDHIDMEEAMIKVYVEEEREATIARFFDRLNRDIVNVLDF